MPGNFFHCVKVNESKIPIRHQNGVMRCYNMFPRQFSNLHGMRSYLDQVSDMGFNVVWINPIQKSGNVVLRRMDKNNGTWEGNTVAKSLYAMSDHNTIERDFSVAPRDEQGNLLCSPDRARALDDEAIKEFTKEARRLGITPIFDLVMNHLSSDSEICKLHPHWFIGTEPQFKDANKFNYRDESTRNEILEKFWKPYIKKYMQEYGFGGMRVDAVGLVHPAVRAAVYDYANQLASDMGIPPPVIFEEALFSGEAIELSIEKLKLPGRGPTHITTGTYYASRDGFSAGLPAWTKTEEGNKASVIFKTSDGSLRENVQGGTVNFTGNHDHNSLAMTVIKELAEKRLAQDPLITSHCHRVEKMIDLTGKVCVDKARHLKVLFPYMQDIIKQLVDKDPEVEKEVMREIRDKTMLCALTSSGGWYVLCGDEFGDLHAKSVFVRENGGQIYPQEQHKIFISEDPIVQRKLNSVLKEMAIDLMKMDTVSEEDQRRLSHNGMYGVYMDLAQHPDKQERFLAAYIDNLKNQINAKQLAVCDQFSTKMAADHDLKISFNTDDYQPYHFRHDNHWGGMFDLREDFKEINRILAALPASNIGFWCEVIAIPDNPDLVAIIRKNGLGLDVNTDLIVLNKNPDVPFKLTTKDVHQIACEFQKRVIPAENQYMGHPDFDKAYYSVMEATLHASTMGVDNNVILSKTRSELSIPKDTKLSFGSH